MTKTLWVDQGSEFYNKTFDKLLKSKNIEIYHTFNEGKAVVVERFIEPLKVLCIKNLTANNTFNYIDSLDRMVSKDNSTIHSAITIKPQDAVHNRNTIKVCNALYENYNPIYPIYTFDIGEKLRIVKKRHLKKDILHIGLKNYLL